LSSRPLIGQRSWLPLRSARIALIILAVVIFLSVFGSALAPAAPPTNNANARFQGPGAHPLLGTDYLGRDVLSRLMAGTRLSVLTAFEAVAIGLVLGAPLGVAAVFLGQWFDFAVNRVSDALMTLPYIFFAVAVTAALGNGLVQAMSAVGILLAPGFFRVTRGATLEFQRARGRVPRAARPGRAAAARPGHQDPLHPDDFKSGGRRCPANRRLTTYCTSRICASPCTTGPPPPSA